jgi:hypothetical protein
MGKRDKPVRAGGGGQASRSGWFARAVSERAQLTESGCSHGRAAVLGWREIGHVHKRSLSSSTSTTSSSPSMDSPTSTASQQPSPFDVVPVAKHDVLDFADFALDTDHRKRRRNRTTQSCLNCHTSKRKVRSRSSGLAYYRGFILQLILTTSPV